MISFTKGEGYGRPLAEFATTGKPILVSKWSGHLDFLDEKGAVLLEGQLRNVDESAANQFLLKDTQWFYVNYTIAETVIRDVYSNYDRYKGLGIKQGEYSIKNFSLDDATDDQNLLNTNKFELQNSDTNNNKNDNDVSLEKRKIEDEDD